MDARHVCFIVLLGCVQANIFTPAFEKDLLRFINETMTCRNIPGLTLSVVKGNESWARGFGMADIDTGRKVTPSTLFNIGSITKSFTATLVAGALKEKGYDWTKKVSDIIDGFKFVDDERTRNTMIRDILSHRTGLARIDAGFVAGYPPSVNRAQLSSRLEYIPEQKPFRDSFLYNNYMYMLAGHVAEVLTGDSWEDAIMSRVLRPIGMKSARLLKQPTDVLANDVAKPYRLDGNKMVNSTLELYELHPVEPSGAILSSAEDMSKWILFNLHQLNMAHSKSNLTEAFQGHVALDQINFKNNKEVYKPDFPVDDVRQAYGYGWGLSTYRGYRKFSHNGGLISYISLLDLFPDMGFGIFGSTNGPSHKDDSILALRTIFYYIGDHLLGETPWLNGTTSCTFPKPWREELNSSKSHRNPASPRPVLYNNVMEYVGSYGHPFLPDIRIEINSSNLLLDMGKLKGDLSASSEKDKFVWKLTYPVEYAYNTENPTSFQVNFTRARVGGVIDGFNVNLDVPVAYKKGLSFENAASNSGLVMQYTPVYMFLALYLVTYG